MIECLRNHIDSLTVTELKDQLNNLNNEIERACLYEDYLFCDEFMPRYIEEKIYIEKLIKNKTV